MLICLVVGQMGCTLGSEGQNLGEGRPPSIATAEPRPLEDDKGVAKIKMHKAARGNLSPLSLIT